MKLSIITLTYNNLKYTKKFIESLYKYTTNFELIIVDNGSTDGTVEYLKTLKNIKLILNKENQGFSKGNNQGIAIAEGEYIGFLNNDILLSPHWFEECEKVFHKDSSTAFVSPKEINPYYENTNEKKYLQFFVRQEYTKDYEKDFDNCVFSCTITSRNIIRKIGTFDEKYSPAFFEDNEFKYRAIEQGFNVYVTNKSCFYHYGSRTSYKFNENFENNRNLYYRNRLFAEYLTNNGERLRELEHRLKLFKSPVFNLCYKLNKFFEKIKRKLLRIVKK